MSVLDKVRASKEQEVRKLYETTSQDALERQIEDSPAVIDALARMERGGRHVIAEIKRASPSRGIIDRSLDPVQTALAYVRGGASAVSVLTDVPFFSGSHADLRSVREALQVPLLRKDFIIDPLQVFESRALGADIILLIVRMHTGPQLMRLRAVADDLGMAALFEVHTAEEIQRALDAGATVVGVNNRDLDSFAVSRQTSLDLRSKVPPDVFAVSESGILDPSDAHEMFDAGYDAVLIGEGLVRSSDKQMFIRRARES